MRYKDKNKEKDMLKKELKSYIDKKIKIIDE